MLSIAKNYGLQDDVIKFQKRGNELIKQIATTEEGSMDYGENLDKIKEKFMKKVLKNF